jgi:hypothetical protein
MNTRLLIVGVVAALSSPLTRATAQAQLNCPSGPGASFGIMAYQCASCGYKHEKGERPAYSFFAEPVVLQTYGAGVLVAGDVVESVNGKPITTSSGAEQFTYPPVGANTIAIRRGRERRVFEVNVVDASAACAPRSMIRDDSIYSALIQQMKRLQEITQRTDSASVRIRSLLNDPVLVIDGVRVTKSSGSDERTGKYGFAVGCLPSCTATTAKEGVTHYTYYRYDGFPPIVAIRAGSPAERAGLKLGDIITKVDGHSVLEAEGALRLSRADNAESLRLTVRRDGKDSDYVIKVR